MQTICAVIPTLNEEKNIKRALTSVQWCDRILVIDAGSTDETVKIAKSMGAVVEIRGQGEKFIGVQKSLNWAGDHCQTDWILRIDADEEVTLDLQLEIKKILENPDNYVAYGVPRKQYFLGGFLKGGDWAFDRLVRLYRPENAKYDPIVEVHEQFKINGLQSVLKSALKHYSHPTWREVNEKWNLYTSLEAKQLKIPKWLAAFKMLTVPVYVFARWMIWHNGWIDGWRGLVAGYCRAYYDFLKYAKFLGLINK